jgi:hypothetical protein
MGNARKANPTGRKDHMQNISCTKDKLILRQTPLTLGLHAGRRATLVKACRVTCASEGPG